MIWQDYVLTAASLIFSVSLIPQVYHGFKQKSAPIKLLTSAPTVVGLTAIAVCYLTLHLYLSAFITTLTNLMWVALMVQRLLYKK